MRIAVIGASGATGGRLVRQAVARGHAVRAVDRAFGAADLPGEAEAWPADILSDDLGPVVRGCDAVLCAFGVPNDPATLADPPPLYTRGVDRIADAMEAEGVRRLVVISASFVEAPDRGPLLFRLGAVHALARVFDEMEEMERRLERREALDWTAMRPGWLLDAGPSGDAVVTDRTIPGGLIRTRTGDLAALMLEVAERRTWVRGHPAVARAEPDQEESSAEVLRAMLGRG